LALDFLLDTPSYKLIPSVVESKYDVSRRLHSGQMKYLFEYSVSKTCDLLYERSYNVYMGHMGYPKSSKVHQDNESYSRKPFIEQGLKCWRFAPPKLMIVNISGSPAKLYALESLPS
jgi:hypothetical protein